MIFLHSFYFQQLFILQEGVKLYSDLKCFRNNGVHCIRKAFKIANCTMNNYAVGYSAVQSSMLPCVSYTMFSTA